MGKEGAEMNATVVVTTLIYLAITAGLGYLGYI